MLLAMASWQGREPLPSRELAAFVAAVDTGSIGAAAESLSLTQSAVTKRIQSLERQLGAALLHRSHNGVRPTRAGEALYPHANEGLLALARASTAFEGDRDRRLNLAASHTPGTFLLPNWLAAFSATSSAKPQVHVVNSEEVLRAVHDRHADIGFMPDPAPDDRLDILAVAEDQLVVAVGSQHKWTRADSVLPKQLASEPFLVREKGSGTRAVAIASLRSLGVELDPELETSSTEALKRALAGGGFTIISSLAIANELRTHQLHSLMITGARLHRTLFAIRRADVPLRGVTMRFWSWLQATRG
jgi:DNA-binding transcriptional LysR family regulator